MFCKECGNEVAENAAVCTNCGVAAVSNLNAKNRLAYILLGIFLGGFGVHNFYAGYNRKAIIQLLITAFLSWLVIPAFVVMVWVIIDICTVDQDAAGVAFN
jgi:TM2 domain-containing membrane protein YozV